MERKTINIRNNFRYSNSNERNIMDNSIFLNIYFDSNNDNKEQEETLQKKMKKIFLNKWFRIYIYNCQMKDKNILDMIYEYANIYGVKISFVIDKYTEILELIEYNYMNIDSVIFCEKDSGKYDGKLKKLGIKSLYDDGNIEIDELSANLILGEKMLLNGEEF